MNKSFACIVGQYVVGFILGRFLEYPLRLIVLYFYTLVFWLTGTITPSQASDAVRSLPTVLWREQTFLWKNILFWGMWIGAGVVAGMFAAWSARRRELRRILNGFSAAIIVLLLFATLVAVGGLFYDLAWMNFLVLPTLLVSQFYLSVLLSRCVPSLYAFLTETHLEGLFSRSGKH